jgi:hypothetical protein
MTDLSMSASRRASRLIGIMIVVAPVIASADAPLQVQLPVDCEVGNSCFVQNLVDHDPGPGASDFMCGHLTYDGHNGTDFRVPDVPSAESVDVLAAADGKVLRRRDGMADVSVRKIGVDAVTGSNCGNGLVIDHGNAWETQYCHLAKDSLTVRPGESVLAGQTIARIGLSGLTEYPHVHFTVRRNGTVVDPFAFGRGDGECGGGESLWSAAAMEQLAYAPGFVINAGFGAGRLDMDAIEEGALSDFKLKDDTPALTAVVRAGWLAAGDVIEMSLSGPYGTVLAKTRSDPLARSMAQHMLLIGKTRPTRGWPRGRYKSVYKVVRNGALLLEREFQLVY